MRFKKNKVHLIFFFLSKKRYVTVELVKFLWLVAIYDLLVNLGPDLANLTQNKILLIIKILGNSDY